MNLKIFLKEIGKGAPVILPHKINILRFCSFCEREKEREPT